MMGLNQMLSALSNKLKTKVIGCIYRIGNYRQSDYFVLRERHHHSEKSLWNKELLSKFGIISKETVSAVDYDSTCLENGCSMRQLMY